MTVSLRFGQIMLAWVVSHLLGTFLPKAAPVPVNAVVPVQVVTLEAAAEKLREIKRENEATRARLEAVAKEITPAKTATETEPTKTE